MNRDDFIKVVGVASEKTEYLPVAFLLCNGYACAGYYHSAVNESLTSTCVLLNARLISLQGDRISGQPTINDFSDFLEEVVVDYCASDGTMHSPTHSTISGKSIPLTAVPFDQIAVVYPVAHIGALMQRAGMQQPPESALSSPTVERQGAKKSRLPTFFDLDKSEIIHLLRTKLW
jgi:hypothetical protein